MKITSQAPCRIGLIGGGTDVNPFASQYKGAVISLAINIYHKVTLTPRNDNQILIENLKQKRKFKLNEKFPQYKKDKDFDLVYAIINYFKNKIPSGFELCDRFDSNHSAGLGSSGSAGVAIIGVFNQWLNLKLNKDKIALLAWQMETKELNWTSGKQDQLMAVYGNINLMTFDKNDKFNVSLINLDKQTKKEFKNQLILTFTGGLRHSSQLQKKLKKGMSDKNKIKALFNLKKSTIDFKKYLLKKDWQKIGQLLDAAWQNKKKSNPSVTNQRIDFLYNLALEKGALGGKIMGAGGEGHMFFFCPSNKKNSVIKALKKEKVEVINFNIDDKGLVVKKYDD